MARPDEAKALERLRRALREAEELKYNNTNGDSPEFSKWYRRTKLAISSVFGEDSSHVKEFTRISFHSGMITHNEYEDEIRNRKVHMTGLQTSCSLLESMIEEIEEYWEEENGAQISSHSPSQENDTLGSNRVFIVHGRDDGSRETVARFLERLKLEPVILNEEASRGKTIIEKFEHHADVGFAVVLLTPDDEGALRGEEGGRSPRARQNVIFELGFFIGRLGRERVCALTKGGSMEIPSDYAGVVYIPLDDKGAWRIELVKELKAAEFDVDANRAL